MTWERSDPRPAEEAWDPHARWAVASGWRGYDDVPRDVNGERLVPVMVEVEPLLDPDLRKALRAALRTPEVYAHNGAVGFITGLLPESRLAVPLPGVKRWRIGLPQVPTTDTELAPAPVTPLGDATKPFFGLIDHGIAFAHRAFRWPDGKPRILAFWDQDRRAASARGLPWKPPKGLGYGSELRADDIAEWLHAASGDEPRCYRNLHYEPAQRRASHGTHVLDLAAGAPDPLRGALDAAASAPIVAVQLPYDPHKDTSGSGLGVQVLDALHYIRAVVPRERAVVVNLSDGAYGGGHAGDSMSERAIDDFLAWNPNVQLVIAAGNAGDARLHACSVESLQPGQRQSIEWRVLPEDATDSFCEVWIDGATEAVELTLQPPQGLPQVTVPLGESRVWRPARGAAVTAAVLSTCDSPNGPGRAMFLVALGPTVARDGGAVAPHGRWRLTLRNCAPQGVTANVWVERDDPVLNARGPRRQSRLVPVTGGGMCLEEKRTLGSLSGCGGATVVSGRYGRGVIRLHDGSTSDQPEYVSQAPGRAIPFGGGPPYDRVDATAPCEDSIAQHGLLAAANRSGARWRMNGTSVAAPQIARARLNELAAATLAVTTELADPEGG